MQMILSQRVPILVWHIINSVDINFIFSFTPQQECDLSCATVLPETDHLFLMYHFHVLYSHSYSVPVLYFNVYQPGKKWGARFKMQCCVSVYLSFSKGTEQMRMQKQLLDKTASKKINKIIIIKPSKWNKWESKKKKTKTKQV